MTIFDLQMSMMRAWTEVAQTWCKLGADTAQTWQRSAAASPQPAFAAPTAAMPSFNWPLAWPTANASPWTALGNGNWMANPMLSNPWLQMFGFPSAAQQNPLSAMFAFWLPPAQPAAISPMAFWQMAAPWMTGFKGFGTWPTSGGPQFGWPLLQNAQQSPLMTMQWATGQPWTMLPWLNPAANPWLSPQTWAAFKWPMMPQSSPPKPAVDRHTPASFRTSSGHASATVIMEPIDLARSIASFWSLDPETRNRKPH